MTVLSEPPCSNPSMATDEPMMVSRSEHGILTAAIGRWHAAGDLSDADVRCLLARLRVRQMDWRRLARYATWCSVTCFIIAFVALVTEDWVIDLLFTIARFFGGFIKPETAGSVASGALAAYFYALGARKRRAGTSMMTRAVRLAQQASVEPVADGERHDVACGDDAANGESRGRSASDAVAPSAVARNLAGAAIVQRSSAVVNAIFVLGALAHAVSAALLWTSYGLDFDSMQLLLAVTYACVAAMSQSSLTWLLGLANLSWWWADSVAGYAPGMYFFGFSAPVRALGLGCVLVALAKAVPAGATPSRLVRFRYTTFVVGLLHTFVALWILSISGIYGRLATATVERLQWSGAFGVAAALSAVYGIKEEDGPARGFGITFLFINLYTQFFEHFWDSTSKAVFFFILGVSLWLIATRSERILSKTRHLVLNWSPERIKMQ